MNKKCLIIDGNNLAHMTFGRNIMSYEGNRTEVIYLGLSMLVNNLRLLEPDKVVVVWDGGKDERRKAICPEYKANRRKNLTEQEEEEWKIFYAQMDKLKNVFGLIGIEQYFCKKREADDVIYNIVNKDVIIDVEVDKFIVMSTDKDFLQLLVNDNVIVYNPVKKMNYTRDVFKSIFGFDVDYYNEWKALVGDKSDNLKGVKGIGEKNATKLILELFLEQNCGNIDRYVDLMLDNLDEWFRMMEIIKFYDIEEVEVEYGRSIYKVDSLEELQNKMLHVLNKYGFNRFLSGFSDFIAPFEQLFLKGKIK